MKDNLLYFPYIDIPKNNWTVKSILYWDKIGIIVPPSYIENPQQYDRFTVDLLQSDLIEPIFPYNYVSQVKGFDESFIRLIDQPEFRLAERQKSFGDGNFSRIHFQKFGDNLLDHLVTLEIAKKKDWRWFNVETDTARLLMIYLATVIGETGNFTPATDEIGNLDIGLSQTGDDIKLNSIRQNLLDDLIPYPIEPDLTKLRRFKDKFHEELTSFRILIESSAFDIAAQVNIKKSEEKQRIIVDEINDKRDKIFNELNQSKFGQIFFGTICSLTGAAVGFVQDNKPLELFSLVSAVYSAFHGYGRKPILSKDYSYLALIDKKFKSLK